MCRREWLYWERPHPAGEPHTRITFHRRDLLAKVRPQDAGVPSEDAPEILLFSTEDSFAFFNES